MITLARWTMESRWRAILVIFITALFSPLLFWLSLPLIALVSLRAGLNQGTQILAVGVVGGLISLFYFGDASLIILAPMVVILGLILRSTISWNYTLLASSLIGLLLVVLSNLFLKASLLDFVVLLENDMQVLLQNPSSEQQALQMTQFFELMKEHIATMVAIGFVQMSLGFLVLARWLQAGVYNPGGFRQEMHGLRISSQVTVVLAIVGIAFWFYDSVTLLLVMLPHSLAGAGLIHYVRAKKELGGWVLVVFYGLLFLAGQIVFPILMLAAIADSFLDLRKYVKAPTGKSL